MPESPAAAEAIRIAADAVSALVGRSTAPIQAAVDLILESTGRVTVTGLGKSGLVGAKLAATLSSTGTPASFVHAADALHGDAGFVQDGDVVIAITGCGGGSALARAADVSIDAGVERECDPNDQAPTASTTVTMVLGDALAVALLSARGFTADDFKRRHPGGALGAR